MFFPGATCLSICKRIVKKGGSRSYNERNMVSYFGSVKRLDRFLVQARISFLFGSHPQFVSRHFPRVAMRASWTRELEESWRLDELQLQPPTPDDSWFYQDRCAPSSGVFPTLLMHGV